MNISTARAGRAFSAIELCLEHARTTNENDGRQGESKSSKRAVKSGL
jgi:hypothetical protein